MMTFGEILKTRRLQKGLTQKELADSVFSTVAAISQFEHDKHMPKTDMIYSIADALGIPVEVLLFTSSDVIREINVSDELLIDGEQIFGYIPDTIALTDVAEHKYKSLKMWNPDYTYDKFLSDVLYPYLIHNPDMVSNLIRAYGQKTISSEIKEERNDTMKEQVTCSTFEEKMEQQVEPEMIPVGQELILSKTVRRDIDKTKNNTLILSNPRAGVHRNVIMPNILGLDRNFVVTDFCGEMYFMAKDKLKAKGYEVKVLCLKKDCYGVEPDDIVRCNPLQLCDTMEQAGNLVDAILQTLISDVETDVLSYEIMRGALEGTISLMREHYPREKWNMGTWLEVLEKTKNETDGDIKLTGIISDELYLQVMTVLQAYSQTIDNITDNEWDLEAFLNTEKHALFIYCDRYNSKYNALNIAFLQKYIQMEKAVTTEKLPTVYVLDEIENIGRMTWLPHELTISMQNIFICIAHTVHGIRTKYGQTYSNMIFNTMDVILMMATHDFETNKFISREFGVLQLENAKYKHRGWKRCTVPALDVSKVMCLHNDECAVIVAGSTPIIDKTYIWDEDF